MAFAVSAILLAAPRAQPSCTPHNAHARATPRTAECAPQAFRTRRRRTAARGAPIEDQFEQHWNATQTHIYYDGTWLPKWV